jgi:Tfp pilus assembly protein PilN
MMINLLPEKEKQFLKERRTIRIFLICGVLILVFFVSFSFSLTALKFWLFGNLVSLEAILQNLENELNFEENQLISKEILSANNRIQTIQRFFKERLEIAPFLKKISHILPANLSLESISFQKNNYQVFIEGFSPSRLDLLIFKSRLEENPEFFEINFPPANWVKPENFNFVVQFKIKK